MLSDVVLAGRDHQHVFLSFCRHRIMKDRTRGLLLMTVGVMLISPDALLVQVAGRVGSLDALLFWRLVSICMAVARPFRFFLRARRTVCPYSRARVLPSACW